MNVRRVPATFLEKDGSISTLATYPKVHYDKPRSVPLHPNKSARMWASRLGIKWDVYALLSDKSKCKLKNEWLRENKNNER